ncbi:developmentally regulated phosphoprotein [Trypanosoma grayi]|uniref:developmentally regulated phosphoprotein n=1 Tax=Trypanosoma grayi TaxID=71804 RepID=UPI0004F469B1|nr:developmentally regulated phosphoprotein [Trypanosoma grayi]KEG15413.1 developmentally regulated phosphoprotein [Trypanosoma grayi]
MRRFSKFVRVCSPLMRWESVTPSDIRAEVNALRKRVGVIEETQSLQALLAFYSSRPLHQLNSLDEVVYYCTRPDYNAEIFCHMELPVLLSRLISAIDALPCGLNAMPTVLLVRNTYLDSFKKLIKCDFPEDEGTVACFHKVLTEIEDAHTQQDILLSMATGLLELKNLLSRHRLFILKSRKMKSRMDAEYVLHEGLMALTKPMDAFSVLMVQYNFLSRMLLNLRRGHDNMIGMVDLQIDLEKVVRNAVDDAKDICTNHYGDCPDVKFIISKDAELMKFPHMSSTISYVVLEVMKNAFRATVEAHMERNSLGIVSCENMPPVEVLVNIKENAQHACICVSDEGLGMTQVDAEMAMTYAYTSVAKPLLRLGDKTHLEGGGTVSPLAGFGFGLPMSRVYARCFGGDLVMCTMEGYGTRVYYFVKL